MNRPRAWEEKLLLAYLASEDEDKALEYAELAYSQDITNLSTYKLLGDLYIAKEDYVRAAESLRVYTTFETEDALSFARLSQAYYELGEYKLAVDAMNKATTLNRTGLRRFYVYRGLSHLELGRCR
jgi:tetratricopeptide (TPR) repeat protein